MIRDIVEVWMVVGGIVVNLLDMVGICDIIDVVEKIGMCEFYSFFFLFIRGFYVVDNFLI